MPDLNIRKVDASLLRALNVRAAEMELTQRDFVIKLLACAVGWENQDGNDRQTRWVERKGAEPSDAGGVGAPVVARAVEHDPRGCKVYGCLWCRMLGHKDGRRGL